MDRATELDIQQSLRLIFGRLGGIDEKLEAGGKRHAEFSQQIAELEAKVEPVAALQGTVEKMQPIVDDYQASRNKLAGMLIAIGALGSGLMLFGNEVKAWVFAKLGVS